MFANWYTKQIFQSGCFKWRSCKFTIIPSVVWTRLETLGGSRSVFWFGKLLTLGTAWNLDMLFFWQTLDQMSGRWTKNLNVFRALDSRSRIYGMLMSMTCWNAWQTLSPDLLVLILFSVKFLPARAANFVKKNWSGRLQWILHLFLVRWQICLVSCGRIVWCCGRQHCLVDCWLEHWDDVPV